MYHQVIVCLYHVAFSGIIQLIRQAAPRNVMLVHGEEGKMQFLKGKIHAEFGIDCYMPANGETVTIQTECKIPVNLSLSMLKRAFTDSSKVPYCFAGMGCAHRQQT